MDEKYVWPLIGVLIGWLLTRVSSYSANTQEKQTKYCRAIAALFLLYDEITPIIRWLHAMKDEVESWEEYEKFRNSTINSHLLSSESVTDMVDKAFYEVSGVDPMLSLMLVTTKKTLQFQKNQSLDGIATLNSQLYLKVIADQELTLNVAKLGIKKMLLKLAKKHGFSMYFKVKKSLKRKESSLAACVPCIKDLKAEFSKFATAEETTTGEV